MNEIPVTEWYTSKTMLTVLVMGALAVLQIAGVVVKVDSDTVEVIVAMLVLVGSIYVGYRRQEATPAAPLNQAQADALAVQASHICGTAKGPTA